MAAMGSSGGSRRHIFDKEMTDGTTKKGNQETLETRRKWN